MGCPAGTDRFASLNPSFHSGNQICKSSSHAFQKVMQKENQPKELKRGLLNVGPYYL